MIELLFVMAIMIGLAAVMAASIGPVQANVSRQRTRGLMKMLGTGLEQFKSEYGSYPKCDDFEVGANILYRTLFGDYNEDGVPDWSRESANPDESVKTFVADLNPGKVDPQTGASRSPFVHMQDGKYILVDAWGTKIYYVSGGSSRHNGTYDLWSLGNDSDPSDENDSMWIRNW
jgi:type II secretory pathway pseudopilin PulG